MRKKVFHSSIKRYLLIILFLYTLYGLSLCYGVLVIYEKIPKNDDFRMPYLVTMIVSGVILLISTVIPMIVNIGKKVTITPTTIEYKHGNREFKITWRDLLYKSPGRNKKLYRTAIISNGVIFANIDNMFFRDFETIVKVIEIAKDVKGSGTIEL